MPEIQSHPCFLTPTQLRPEAPLFVFLPGMDGTGQLLRAQTAGLESAFDVRCLAIPPDDLTDWDDLAKQVVQLTQAELANRSPRAVYLCGESFGGCLAIKVGLHAPDLYQRIILINPASSFNRRPWISWGSQFTRWLPQPVYQFASVAFLPLLAYFGRMAPSDRHAFLETVQSVPQKTSIWRLSLLSQFDVTPAQLSHLTQPVLLIASGSDLLLPSLAEVNQLAEDLPNAKIHVLPASGHVCLMETDVNLYEILQTTGFLAHHQEQQEISS